MADATGAQGTPDGGSGNAGGSDGSAGGDTVSRTELDKATSRRDSAIADKNAALKDNAELQVQINDLKATAATDKKAALADVTKELADARSTLRRRDFADAVLGGIPTNDQREQADLMLTGLMAKEGTDPNSDNWEEAAKKTADSLRTLAPHLFAAPTATQPQGSGGGSQASPDPKDWSKYTRLKDVPREHIGKIPKRDYERLKMGDEPPIPGFTRAQ